MTRTRTKELAALEALDDRARSLVERARATDASGSIADEVAATRDGLLAALRDGAATDPGQAAALCDTLAALTALQAGLTQQTVEQRFGALARIHDGLTRLREEQTVAGLLARAAEELCGCCDFDRSVISRVHGAQWTPEVVHFDPDTDPEITSATRAYLLGDDPLPLGSGMFETHLARRRTAAVITEPLTDPRAHGPLVAATSTPGYAVAPVMPAGRVIGFLHADCLTSGRPLGTLDRDNIWTFAEGFGLIYERLVLFERLREQRDRARAAFGAAEAQIDALSDAEVELARHEQRAGSTVSAAAGLFGGGSPQSAIDRLLSAREREVMELMATGARNREIADRLVITPETVKSHVKKIRRKLRAANRAEAVSRYLQMTMGQRLP